MEKDIYVNKENLRIQKFVYKEKYGVMTAYEIFFLVKRNTSLSFSFMSLEYKGKKESIFEKFFVREKGELDIYSFTLFKKTFEISIYKKGL